MAPWLTRKLHPMPSCAGTSGEMAQSLSTPSQGSTGGPPPCSPGARPATCRRTPTPCWRLHWDCRAAPCPPLGVISPPIDCPSGTSALTGSSPLPQDQRFPSLPSCHATPHGENHSTPPNPTTWPPGIFHTQALPSRRGQPGQPGGVRPGSAQRPALTPGGCPLPACCHPISLLFPRAWA